MLRKLQLQADADCPRDCLGRVDASGAFGVLVGAVDHLFDAFEYDISLAHLVQPQGMIYQ